MASNILKISRFLFYALIILIVNKSITRASPLSGTVDPVEPHELPFVVSIGNELIKDETSNPYGHFCGGALITRRYVLTSANCFSSNIAIENYIVYIGAMDLQESQKFRIDSWVTHDVWLNTRKYRPRGYYFSDNDVAIAKLAGKMAYCRTIPKIARTAPTNLENVIIAGWGWGAHLEVDYPRYLLRADLKVVPSHDCIASIRDLTNDYNYHHEHNFFCTYTKSLTVDVSDRGSPIFIRKDDGKYLIVGVHQKSFPSVTEVTLPEQLHKHISLYYYEIFLNNEAHITYGH